MTVASNDPAVLPQRCLSGVPLPGVLANKFPLVPLLFPEPDSPAFLLIQGDS